ncbi:dTDP-4-dehydrorhamnose reductase [Mariprofundus ferrooxydans]|uniref:dTDP-4-dehydrorhamnose reductase n=1 Tax=Mariprofundus ferrooxydans TaxID=314344 RepID=UPI00037893A0|nr:dTDP-4-dehydrorhamnose reductase [Mariprofundus ferrooxydans]
MKQIGTDCTFGRAEQRAPQGLSTGSTKSVLITGAYGQLGHELTRLGQGHELLAVDRDALDITDYDAVTACLDQFKPDAVINAAAYTAVDRAESDLEVAFSVNRDGPDNLARACGHANIPLIHVSTDYVFDGLKQGAYVESDPVAPLGVYGASKLAGEQAVLKQCPKSIILRTSWVFSAHGQNFVKTMLRLGTEREELGIVADQHGCPTSAAELARAIYAVLDKDLNDNHRGVYHFCQPEPTTWFAFANAVFDSAREQGIDLSVNTVNAIATTDYPTPAERPANSVMDCNKFEQSFGFTVRPWRDSLDEVIRELSDVRGEA